MAFWVSGILSFLLFAFFCAWGIYTGDTGDLVTAGYLFGVPHPPGYPLYTFLVFLSTHIPAGTVALRASLLSALFHAATVAFVYLLTLRITKKWWAGVFAALTLAGNYVFFLYSVTPEVFALFDLFVVLIAYILWEKRFAALAFVSGVSFSHHHLILFFVPGAFSVLRTHIRTLIRYIPLFLLGLVPYLYIPLAARNAAIINWNWATDLIGFLRLVSRADYGTFRSGAIFGEALSERLVQVGAYARFVLLDMGWVGVALAVLGIFSLWRKRQSYAIFVVVSLVLIGPAYFFYASFPLVNRFMLATFERFLLPSYVLLALLAACGLASIAGRIKNNLLSWGVVVVLFVSPMVFLGMNLYRFWGLPQDRTAERLGSDVLTSIPEGTPSVLLLSRDTTLFTTQYMRYVEGVREDVVALAFNQLGDARYRALVSKNFPMLVVPQDEKGFFFSFLTQNVRQYRIFSNTRIPLPEGWALVPYGLVFELLNVEDAPGVDELRSANEELWAAYQNPQAGILGRYNHLMLSDVRDVYAGARLELGKAYVRADEIAWARDEFKAAVSLGGDIIQADAYTYLGLSELWLGNCDAALLAFREARAQQFVPNEAITLYESVTYKDCVGDEGQAEALFEKYEHERRVEEIPLETL